MFPYDVGTGKLQIGAGFADTRKASCVTGQRTARRVNGLWHREGDLKLHASAEFSGQQQIKPYANQVDADCAHSSRTNQLLSSSSFGAISRLL